MEPAKYYTLQVQKQWSSFLDDTDECLDDSPTLLQYQSKDTHLSNPLVTSKGRLDSKSLSRLKSFDDTHMLSYPNL